MNDTHPIACSLGADDRSARLAEMADLGRASLTSSERNGSLAVLRFAATSSTRSRLAEIVAAERECCPFLSFDLRADGGELALSVGAPHGGELMLDEIVSAFASDRSAA